MTSQADLKGLRVLVVEDEMMVSMLIEDMLSDLGCTVVGPASRLDEAIELANQAELDCAVLDVNLGAENGLDVLVQIQKQHPGLPIVMFTAQGNIKTAVEAMRRGAVSCSKARARAEPAIA